jgi:hypothetical protein
MRSWFQHRQQPVSLDLVDLRRTTVDLDELAIHVSAGRAYGVELPSPMLALLVRIVPVLELVALRRGGWILLTWR